MKNSEFKPRNDRERRMWRYMNAHSDFQYSDVMREAKVSRHHMDIFAAKLRRSDLIKKVSQKGPVQSFTVMDDTAAKAFASRKRGMKEGVIWTAMRSLKTFTSPEIMLVIANGRPDVSEDEVHKYCGLILKARYLAVIQKARPGSHPARYRLVNDTGPLPPVKRTLQVLVDGNEDRIAWAQGERI